MNLFILDEDPIIAASYYSDPHVCKIILESAQLMAMSYPSLDKAYPDHAPQIVREGRYAPRHSRKHPVAIWTCSTRANYDWTAKHAIALCREYSSRYNKIHKTDSIVHWLAENPPMNDGDLTPFAQALPDEYKNQDPVIAYRNYYKHGKAHLLRYKMGNVPAFLEN